MTSTQLRPEQLMRGEQQTVPRPRSGPWLWIMVGVACLALIGQSVFSPLQRADAPIGGPLAVCFLVWQLLATVFVFWHGGRRYGAGGIIAFFVVTFVISNIYENVSIATGFPFGHYHYTHDGAPFLLQVPITIGISYVNYGYLSWCVASAILGRGDRLTRSWLGTVVQPATAAFVMVMWDLVMDPINSTIGHTWIWHQGGGYNGVPLTNYLGWFLTVWTLYQVFALILHARPGLIRPGEDAIGFRAMPVLLYGLTALTYILGYALTKDASVTDAAGHAWSVSSIWESSVTVMLFTMLFASFLAAVSLLRERLAAEALR